MGEDQNEMNRMNTQIGITGRTETETASWILEETRENGGKQMLTGYRMRTTENERKNEYEV